MSFKPLVAATATAVMMSSTAAFAAHLSYYSAALTPLNDSGVSGDVYLTYDDGSESSGMRSLLVQVRASGLEPGAHPGHIHGFEGTIDADGNASVQDSIVPVPPAFFPQTSGDGDGFTELAEGVPFYGPILQTFVGLAADMSGNIRYDRRFDVEAGGQLDNDIFDLANRETVLHGVSLPFGFDLDENGDPIGGSVDPGVVLADAIPHPLLPVASGEFVATTADSLPSPVPLPAGVWLIGAALGSLGVARKMKKKAA